MIWEWLSVSLPWALDYSVPGNLTVPKEGRIIRIMQGSGRISINLIEYEATAHDIIIIPDNSLIEILESVPTMNSSPHAYRPFSACDTEFHSYGSLHTKRDSLFMQQHGMDTHQPLFLFIMGHTSLFALPPRNRTALDCLTSL